MSETPFLLPRDSDAKYLGCFTVRKLRFPQISTTWAMVRPKDCPSISQDVMTYGKLSANAPQNVAYKPGKLNAIALYCTRGGSPLILQSNGTIYGPGRQHTCNISRNPYSYEP
ncbi:hypothetical protein I7I51_02927 [Histoplasma capsulatum]|uniref:Uncharacterized protein n=1 Tax=Ajellomyces capsulatus TaxID=5037 RepID=A0A8A1MJF1_AJECA|nr:hypothetical protein I7I51_02927 [Histoplasma capsulatum]